MTPRIQSGIGARLQKDTSAAVRCLSSDAKGYRCTGDTSNPRYGIKNNKALIKAEDLKSSSDARRVNSLDLARQSSRMKMARFVVPVFNTNDRR